jgi:hypothetical protein
MSKNETIEVYWSPATYIPEQESWALLYPEPLPVFADLVKKSTPKNKFTTCPAVKNTLKNVFALRAAIDDTHTLDPRQLKQMAKSESEYQTIESPDGFLPLQKPRASSIEGFIDVTYHMRWLFFASEPLEMRLSAPYFPANSPTEGALFAPGEFNIGKWYRQINLDWHIPVDSTSFSVKADDPLAFIEFKTDKKIVLKRYNLTQSLMNLAFEASDSSRRMGKFKTLVERYKQAHSAKIPQLVLSEIRKNLVEEENS